MRRTHVLCLTAAAALCLTATTACSAASKATGAAAGAAKDSVVSVADALSLSTKTTSGFTSSKVNMTMEMPGAGTTTMTGAMSRKPIAVDLTLTNAQLPDGIHLLMSGTTEYMNMGATGAKEFGGKHWLKIDFSTLGADGKTLAAAMDKNSSQDPAAAVKLLTSSGDIKRVGKETVDGVSTTHYAGTVDIGKLVKQSLGDDAGLKSIVDQADKAGMSTEAVDMWINDQNLPVKVHETASTAKGAVDITIRYSDYSNTPVQIALPPTSDTTDLASLTKK